MPHELPSTVDLSAALNALGAATLIVEAGAPERAIVYANAAFTQLTGYPSSDVLGRGLSTLAAPGNDPAAEPELRAALAAMHACTVEWLVQRRDGRSLWTRITLKPIAGAASPQFVATLEDISAYKQARASVRASEARLDVAMEGSDLSMWDWDVELDKVYYNDRWRSSLGFESRELLARASLPERLMLPTAEPALLERFEQHFHGASSHFEAEYALPTRSGELKWFRAYARVVRRSAEGRAAACNRRPARCFSAQARTEGGARGGPSLGARRARYVRRPV